MAKEALKEQLNRWHDANCKNGSLSWQSLANKADVSESYICKIARGEAANPSYRVAKSLMTTIFSSDVSKAYTFLKEYYPKETPSELEFLRDSFTCVDDRTTDLLRDRDTYRIYKIALTGEWGPKDLPDIQGLTFVEDRVNALLDAGILEVDQSTGKLQRTEAHKRTIVVDPERLSNEFAMVNEILRQKKSAAKLGHEAKTQIDETLNRYMFYHDSLNEKGAALLAKRQVEFINSTHKELSQAKYKGNIPVFTNIAAGRFDDK